MKKFLAAAFVALACAGCVKSPVVGGIYTDVKGYVGLVALGDASIQTAARDAGITRIHHVDYQAKSYVGVYTIYTVIVYGD